MAHPELRKSGAKERIVSSLPQITLALPSFNIKGIPPINT
jgi:hypothetical protein